MAQQLLNATQKDSNTSTYGSHPKDEFKKSTSTNDGTSEANKPKASIQVGDNNNLKTFLRRVLVKRLQNAKCRRVLCRLKAHVMLLRLVSDGREVEG